MGVNKGGKLIKRGPVQVILKEANEKYQLIVRSDDALGNKKKFIYPLIICLQFQSRSIIFKYHLVKIN